VIRIYFFHILGLTNWLRSIHEVTAVMILGLVDQLHLIWILELLMTIHMIHSLRVVVKTPLTYTT